MGVASRIGNPSRMSRELRDYIEKEYWRPALPKPSNFVKYSILILIGVVAALLFVAGFGRGDDFLDRLGDSYRTIYNVTTNGNTWTSIMEDNFLYFIVPALIILVGLGLKLNLGFANRSILMYVALGIGFVGGHVFWPT